MSNNYLFALTITPIQSFIAQAKSTKDFYSGSQIISKLIQELLEVFLKHDIEVIFPKDKSIVSNKIIVKIDISDQERIIGELQQKVDEFLLLDTLCNGIKLKTDSKSKEQLQDVFKLFYASVEIKNGYQESYLELEKSLAMVKNLRPFNPIISKNICYVCGVRESYCRDNENKKRCSVCYLKSKYDDSRYLSTAGIASLFWQQNIDTRAYIKEFKSFDEALFFEENLDQEYLQRHHKMELDNRKIKTLKEKRNRLSMQKKPTKQYALINFDGDNIGKILSNGLDGIELEAFHKEFSTKLSSFAKEVKELISDEKGRVIYSGGDDFLGFVTLYYLDEVLEKIRESFETNVNTYQEPISYSTAIVIAHYKAPLHKIIQHSRALLDETKKRYSSHSTLVKGGVGMEIYSTTSLLAKFIGEREEFVLLNTLLGKKVNLYPLQQIFYFAKEDMSYSEYLQLFKMIKIELNRFLLRKEVGFSNREIVAIEKLLLSQVQESYIIDLENFFGFFKTIEQLSKDSYE